ncbi:MAG: crossover junction endodeoxyribonuclease RuvC [Terriglobia bacterium]
MASAPSGSLRILGIDPGLNITGYGVIDLGPLGARLAEAGVIRLPRSSGENLPARLAKLFEEVESVMEEFGPQRMCLEEVYGHAAFPKTSILMSHARGVICLAAQLRCIPVSSFPAKRIKQSVTGNGNASKQQVQRAVRHLFSLEQTPHPPDVADALAAALCYLNSAQRASILSGNGGLRLPGKSLLCARDRAGV